MNGQNQSGQARIAIDYTAALDQGGGIGRYTRELIGAIAALDTDLQFRLFAMGRKHDDMPPTPSDNFTWRVSRISYDWFARLWHRAQLPLPVEHWVGDIQLYHATDFTLPPTRKSTSTILTVHDLSFVRAPETATKGLREYLNRVVPSSIDRANHVLADSESTRRDIMDLYGTTPDKVSVLYSGVNGRFKPVADEGELQRAREKYGLGSSDFIFSLGTVQPRKNYGRLAEAFHRLDRPDLLLVIAGGKGWLEDAFYQKIDELGLQDRIRLIGFADDADLPVLYSTAKIFVFPALYEGFGLPPLEAMACGTPVVTSSVSSLPEVVGDAGIQVDPYNIDAIAEAIDKLLRDTDLITEYVTRGFERAKLFSWEQSARQLINQYRVLLGK